MSWRKEKGDLFLFFPPPQRGFHAPFYVIDMNKLVAYCYWKVPLALLFKYPSLPKQGLSPPSHTKPSMNIHLCVCPTNVPRGQLGGWLGPRGSAPAPPEYQHLSLTDLGHPTAWLPRFGERHAGCRLGWDRAQACTWMAKYGMGGGQSCA